VAGSFVSVAPTVAPPRARPSARGPRWARLAATVLLCASLLLAAVVAGAAALGIRTAVVLTGSMRPAFAPNDMLLTERTAAAAVRPGDVISFAAPDQAGVVITHRVSSIAPVAAGRLAFVTKGDANNTAERWTIERQGTVARVMGVLPGVGALTEWTGRPTTRIAIFGLLGALLLWFGLRAVWRR
jgi:signal peptidase